MPVGVGLLPYAAAMDALAGPYLASALLLVVAGAAKVRDPLPLVRALRSAWLPAPVAGVRLLAVAEVVLGLAAVLRGGRVTALLVALSYATFTGFVLVARHRGGVLASCGCFGRADTPPTTGHVVVTGALALLAVGVAAAPLGTLPEVLAAGPSAGLPLVLATVTVAVLVHGVLALLPALRVAR
jgi:hypothetical protein